MSVVTNGGAAILEDWMTVTNIAGPGVTFSGTPDETYALLTYKITCTETVSGLTDINFFDMSVVINVPPVFTQPAPLVFTVLDTFAIPAQTYWADATPTLTTDLSCTYTRVDGPGGTIPPVIGTYEDSLQPIGVRYNFSPGTTNPIGPSTVAHQEF